MCLNLAGIEGACNVLEIGEDLIVRSLEPLNRADRSLLVVVRESGFGQVLLVSAAFWSVRSSEMVALRCVERNADAQY